MLRKAVFVLFCLALTVAVCAQDLSIKKAVLSSLVVPGAGQYYAGSTTRAGVFLGTELLFWFGYFQMNRAVDWEKDNYMKLASVDAGIPVDSPDWVYSDAVQYYSSDEYNNEVIQEARNYYLLYQNDPSSYQTYLDNHLIPEDRSWSWNSKQAWRQFHRMRGHKQDLEIYTKLAVGAVLFNHMVSAIDAARLARKVNHSHANNMSFLMAPDWQKKGVVLNCEYRF